MTDCLTTSPHSEIEHAIVTLAELARIHRLRAFFLIAAAEETGVAQSRLLEWLRRLQAFAIVEQNASTQDRFRFCRPGSEIFLSDVIQAIGQPVFPPGCGSCKSCRALAPCMTAQLAEALNERIILHFQTVPLNALWLSDRIAPHTHLNRPRRLPDPITSRLTQ